jgi:hypothetical protein
MTPPPDPLPQEGGGRKLHKIILFIHYSGLIFCIIFSTKNLPFKGEAGGGVIPPPSWGRGSGGGVSTFKKISLLIIS